MDEYRKKTGGSGFCAIAAMAVLVVTITLVCGFVLKTQRSTLSEIEAMLKKAEHELVRFSGKPSDIFVITLYLLGLMSGI